jgi:hypothetical protein
MTLWLWPSTSDFSPDTVKRPQPVIDLTEAMVDGALIGRPPSVKQFTQAIEEAESVREKGAQILKVGASFHLWKTLIIEPVVGSAFAMAASVKSNEILLENVQSRAAKGEWIQGDTRPYTKDAAAFFDRQFVGSFTTNALIKDRFTDTFDTKVEAFGQIRFRLDWGQALQDAYRPDRRISHYLNTLSTDLETAAYNALPFSFVADWFTTAASTQMRLENKVKAPLMDWYVTSSLKHSCTITREGHYRISATKWEIWMRFSDGSTVKYYNLGWRSNKDEPKLDDDAKKRGLYLKIIGSANEAYSIALQTESHEHYIRTVAHKPSPGRASEFNDILNHRPIMKGDPLTMEKAITLGALLITLGMK